MHHYFDRLFQSLATILLAVFYEMFHEFDKRYCALFVVVVEVGHPKTRMFKKNDRGKKNKIST